jgi:predicted GNAT superfamily acetyltransferase
MRKNAWFNLAKLHARATEYHPNLYGVMIDELNGGDETDRCLVRWRLDRPFVAGLPGPVPPANAAVALISSATHSPIVHRIPLDGDRMLMCQVPDDVVAWRRRDPGLAREWRLALRHTMGKAMAAGYSATGMTRDGWYLLEKVQDE